MPTPTATRTKSVVQVSKVTSGVGIGVAITSLASLPAVGDIALAAGADDLVRRMADAIVAADLSVGADRLETARQRQDDAVSILADRAAVKLVDVAETTVRVSQLEASLEASFSALGTLTSLSLTDYL